MEHAIGICPAFNEINFLLVLMVPGDTILSLCLVDAFCARLCNDENFWKNKIEIDYNKELKYQKPLNITWKSYYIQISNLKQKYIYFQGIPIGHIWIKRSNTIADTIKKAIILFNALYPEIDPYSIVVDHFKANNYIRAQHLHSLLYKPNSAIYILPITEQFYGFTIWDINAFEIRLQSKA